MLDIRTPLVAFSLVAALGSSRLWADEPAPVPPDADAFARAVESADANGKTEAGKAYEARVAKHFNRTHAGTVRRCASWVTKPDYRDFQLAVRVGSDGKVKETLVDPRTDVGHCVAESVGGDTFPPPPADSYWVVIGVKLKKR
jgi:hypothetical protein